MVAATSCGSAARKAMIGLLLFSTTNQVVPLILAIMAKATLLGFEFLQPIDMDELVASDTRPVGHNVAAMTEAYRYRYGFAHRLLKDDDDSADPDRLITSPEIADLKNDFSGESYGDFNYDWLDDKQKEHHPLFKQLYDDLVAGKLPALRELHDLLQHDTVTAVAFDVMDQIANFWVLSPEEQHRRYMDA